MEARTQAAKDQTLAFEFESNCQALGCLAVRVEFKMLRFGAVFDRFGVVFHRFLHHFRIVSDRFGPFSLS